jgi:hypothetical protein
MKKIFTKPSLYIYGLLILCLAIWLIAQFDKSFPGIVSDEKIDSVQRSGKTDNFTISYGIENTDHHAAYRFLVRTELGVIVKINFYDEKQNVFQPLTSITDEIHLKAGEKRTVTHVISVSEKEYARSVGAVAAPQLRVAVMKAEKV